jgi:hypothetical protein
LRGPSRRSSRVQIPSLAYYSKVQIPRFWFIYQRRNSHSIHDPLLQRSNPKSDDVPGLRFFLIVSSWPLIFTAGYLPGTFNVI